MADGLAAALQPAENVAALVCALCHEAAGAWSGEIFYVEKDRLGVFDPLGVGQDAVAGRDGAGWTVDGVLERLAGFAPHAMGVVYADD